MQPGITIRRYSERERREAIADAADRYRERVVSDVQRAGFEIDWQAVLADLGSGTKDEVLLRVEKRLTDELRADEFTETVRALAINGEFIARYAIERSEDELRRQAKVKPKNFAETPNLATVDGAVDFWRALLELSDEEIRLLLERLARVRSTALAMAARVSDQAVRQMATLYSETIESGTDLGAFVTRAQEIMPDATRTVLETEYRTQHTAAYSAEHARLIRARPDTFPFLQYMIVKDAVTTWWICLPMGTAGPDKRGYIAASSDGIWIEWRPPNHYRCRAVLSPISYREAQRYGILAADGRTKIAIAGSNPERPYGDPPRLAEDPKTGRFKRVEPAEGFGA